MNSIRARFARGEEVKYISHLDLMKVFERALRRSRIPISYSQGFNPHPGMVFGLPLSVGVTSEAEYVDFDFDREMGVEDFKEKLNANLPKGLHIMNAAIRGSKGNIMAAISASSYDISVSVYEKQGIENLNSFINEFMSKQEIYVKKETKSGLKDVNIRPLIKSLKVDSSGSIEGVYSIHALLSAGSVANLRPDLLFTALNAFNEIKFKLLNIHRTGLFVDREGKALSPLDSAVL